MSADTPKSSEVRLDKWLWAARFFKTRVLAAQAVAGGKVKLNGERVRPARTVRVADELRIQVGPYEYLIKVCGLSARRGPAAEAAMLYQESEESLAARKQLADQLAAEKRLAPRDKGRPSKRARRDLIRFKQGDSR